MSVPASPHSPKGVLRGNQAWGVPTSEKARKKVERRLRATVDPETYQRLVNKLYFFSL
jgi:hypothetical protein